MRKKGQIKYFRREARAALGRCWWPLSAASAIPVLFTVGANTLCRAVCAFFGLVHPVRIMAVSAVFAVGELAVVLPYLMGMIRACRGLVDFGDRPCLPDMGGMLYFFGSGERYFGCLRVYLSLALRNAVWLFPCVSWGAAMPYLAVYIAPMRWANAAGEWLPIASSAIFVALLGIGAVCSAGNLGAIYLKAISPELTAGEVFDRSAELLQGRHWQAMRLALGCVLPGALVILSGGVLLALYALPYWAVLYTLYMSFLHYININKIEERSHAIRNVGVTPS